MKVNLSYAMSNIAPQYEYTDAMYKEDYRIAHWCVHVKYASKFPEKSIAKEDLVQYCVTRLWQKRPTYDPTKSKYSTWAIIVCRSVLRNYSIVKRQFEDSQCDKLDRAIFTDELGNDFCLLETLGEPDKEPVDDLIRIIYQAVDSIHAPKMRTKAKQAVDLFMQGKVQYLAEVGKIMGCTREYARLLLKKVRTHTLQIATSGTCPKWIERRGGRGKPKQRNGNATQQVAVDLSQVTFRQLYYAKGFTQKELAKRVGVTPYSIKDWASGKCRPRPKNIKKLANVFNCTYKQMQAIILRKE